MDERRRDEGTIIVIGCLLAALLVACLVGGLAFVWTVPVPTQQEQQATIEEQQAQLPAFADEEKAAPQQETTQPEVK
jgi:hypothetical protein